MYKYVQGESERVHICMHLFQINIVVRAKSNKQATRRERVQWKKKVGTIYNLFIG